MSARKVSPTAPLTDAPPAYTQGGWTGGQAQPGYNQYLNYSTDSAFVQLPPGPHPGSTFVYRENPALITCQHCHSTVTTTLRYKSGLLTWAASGIIFLVGGVLGCCLIPFCIRATKDVKHECPNCKKMVGIFRHMS